MKIPVLLLFNRGKVVLFVGTLILCLGVIFPWYRLPTDILKIFNTNIAFTNIGKFITAILALIALLSIFNRLNHPPRLAFWGGLIATLLFPYFMTTWSPTVDFIASAYYNQGENVSLHVDHNFSQVQSQWKQNIVLSKSLSPPKMGISIPDSKFFQMSSWDQVIFNGFGYKNSFLAFIGKGWSFSLIGLVISLVGLYLGEKQILQTWVQDLSLLLPVICLLCALILIPLVVANIIDYQINAYFAQGDYTKVVQQSESLFSWYPSFQGNVDFLERLAKAEFYTDKSDLALINFVKGLENYRTGNFALAEEYLQKSLVQPKLFVVRSYLAAAIVNQGVSYLDDPKNRQPAAAAVLFEKALQIFPNHLEALYNLMLARVINGEFSHSAEVAERIIASQEYFQNQRIGLMGQAYLHFTWAEYKNGDINKAWELYRQSVDAKTWGKKTKKEKK